MKKKEKIIGEIRQREGRREEEERKGNRNKKIVYSTYDHTQLQKRTDGRTKEKQCAGQKAPQQK